MLYSIVWFMPYINMNQNSWISPPSRTSHSFRLSQSTRFSSLYYIASSHCCSVTKSCLTLCDPHMDCMPDFLVLHSLPESAQWNHVHWVSDAIQPSCRLSPTSPPALNLSQYQDLFQWAGALHQATKVLELQHQSFQWIFRVDYL